MNKYSVLLLAILLLTACQSTSQQAGSPAPAPTPTPMATVTLTPEPTPSPTPEPSSVGIELDVGDGEHKFWVELTKEGEGKRVNIYEKQGDTRPIQTFEDTEGFVSPSGADLTAEDVNFDGYMDFHFCTSFGYSIVSHSSYYVWDPEEGCFVPDPYGLNELSTAEFLPYVKEVRSLSRGPMGTGTVSYCYENGVLVKVGEGFTPEADSDWKAYTARRIKVDEDHVFWVEITQREELEGEESGTPILVSIYEESNGELKQSFEDEVWLGSATPREVDVNFDGCMDFEYGSWIAASSGGSAYYVWDKETEQFVRDPYGLEDLDMPSFDQERQVIETWNHSGCSYTIEFYRYLDGKLTCVRRLENRDNNSDDFTATLTVENYDEKTGTLKEVYRKENAEIGGVTYASTEEFERWHDLDYPGK